MQIIEVTGYAMPSAVFTLRRKGSPLEFVVFPMLHVASPTFYLQDRRRLRTYDLIVMEGIKGKSAGLSALTLAYRFAPRRRRNRLVEQSEARLLPEGVPVLYPDVTATEAMADLRALPRTTYALLMVGAPLMGLVFAVRGPRAFLDEDQVVEDLPSTLRAEMLAGSDVEHAMTDRRDRRLLDALGAIHAERRHEPIRVAVVYGAGHVTAIVSGLAERYGYLPRRVGMADRARPRPNRGEPAWRARWRCTLRPCRTGPGRLRRTRGGVPRVRRPGVLLPAVSWTTSPAARVRQPQPWPNQ